MKTNTLHVVDSLNWGNSNVEIQSIKERIPKLKDFTVAEPWDIEKQVCFLSPFDQLLFPDLFNRKMVTPVDTGLSGTVKRLLEMKTLISTNRKCITFHTVHKFLPHLLSQEISIPQWSRASRTHPGTPC